MARPHRRAFLLIGALGALGAGFDLAAPLVYRTAVNDVAGVFVNRTYERQVGAPAPASERARSHRPGHVAPRTAPEAFRKLLSAVALLFVLSLAANFFALAADGASARVANGIEKGLIIETFGHVLQLPFRFFVRRPSGGIARQIDQSDEVAPIVSAFTHEIFPEAVRVIGIIGIMITQSRQLTLAAIATLPAYLWVARRSANRLEKTLAQYYPLWEEVSSRIQDALAAIKTVKLSGAEARETGRLDAAASEAYVTFLERNRLENRYLFWQEFLIQLGKALVLAFGGWRVLQRQLTPGDVVMFVAYLDRLYDPIGSLTGLGATLQQHAASVRRALKLLEVGGGEASGEPLPPGPGRIEFRDVHFGYTPGREVLKGLSLVISPGRTTALVGPSGAGKTTTVDLLLRLYEPSAGTITIEGVDLARLDPAAVRREIGVVSAEGAIFRGTLAYNIRYNRPDASDAEVREAAVAAGLESTLGRLPQGLRTDVGERGVGLSVGERQRLALARVLLANPRLLVLDEATANLDYATEAEVKATLQSARAGRTTLMVAHRYSMVRDADFLAVLEDGRIIESGTPAELIAMGGWFARWSRQFERAETERE
jgi:ABC-type multidrug transport system fused ATPase/permease subunit